MGTLPIACGTHSAEKSHSYSPFRLVTVGNFGLDRKTQDRDLPLFRCPPRHPNQELIWASPRKLLNIFQAEAIGCHIITVTNDILQELDRVGRLLGASSLGMVKMLDDEPVKAGYTL